jgi:dCMP deaminase
MRASWDTYFMELATKAASRATCDRKHVGAVIVQDRDMVCSGYNGSLSGMPHCDDIGHMMVEGHCVRTIHAEINAIARAAKRGIKTEGASIYVTASPCWSCFKTIVAAGIQRVVFGEFYRDERIFDVAKALNITLVDMSPTAIAVEPSKPLTPAWLIEGSILRRKLRPTEKAMVQNITPGPTLDTTLINVCEPPDSARRHLYRASGILEHFEPEPEA